MCLVMTAAYLAQHYDLGPKIDLDFRGATATGTAEQTGEGAYRLSYQHPSGSIHAHPHQGGLGWQRLEGDKGDITIVFNLSRAAKFQPKGMSYTPGSFVGLLFLAGMACVLRARRIVMRQRPKR
jgi:hypothetical protein